GQEVDVALERGLVALLGLVLARECLAERVGDREARVRGDPGLDLPRDLARLLVGAAGLLPAPGARAADDRHTIARSLAAEVGQELEELALLLVEGGAVALLLTRRGRVVDDHD